jgi:hypothetical protein
MEVMGLRGIISTAASASNGSFAPLYDRETASKSAF